MRFSRRGVFERVAGTVAGVVGEMLTELFAQRIPAFSRTQETVRCARAFGEGLQLVSILSDSSEAARHSRSFLPRGVERSQLHCGP